MSKDDAIDEESEDEENMEESEDEENMEGSEDEENMEESEDEENMEESEEAPKPIVVDGQEPKPNKSRRAVRRSKKVEPEKDSGELEPFDLKSYFIPKDRKWVLPVFVAIVVLLFGYYMVVFMGVVNETCTAQAEIGDEDCDGYVDDPETSPGDSSNDGSDSNNNTTSGDLSNNGIENGLEWLNYGGKDYYRTQGSMSEWTEFQR